MVVVIFRSRIKDNIDIEALDVLGNRMAELAAQIPGFISYTDFSNAGGKNLALVEFADTDALLAWRNHPEHVRAQERGREEFFAEYQIQVCTPIRQYEFPAGEGRVIV